MSIDQAPESRDSLLAGFRRLADAATSLEALQNGVVQEISRHMKNYDWTGFYMLDPDDPETLVLGPFVGTPTPHVRIPVGKGICGAAVAGGKTIIVDDVNSDPRYLSCSIETRSEIVVPIYAHGRIVGEIDIDSNARAAFTEDDRLFLEETAAIVGAFIEGHSG